MADSQAISGTRFIGNSIEHFVAFEKLKFAVRLRELREKINAAVDQLVEDLQLDIDTCTLQCLDPPQRVYILGQEAQDEAAHWNRPAEAATQEQDGELR